MSSNKQPKQKGLSDSELVAKYEAGRFNMKSAAKKVLSTPVKAGSALSQTKKER